MLFSSSNGYSIAPGTSSVVFSGGTVTCQAEGTGYVGDGHTGAVTFTTSATVNTETPLTAGASIGGTSLSVLSSSGFTAGGLVLVIQMQGASLVSGNQNAFQALGNVGQFELARVTSVGSGQLGAAS
jgi:hypothetical protein